jgi:peptidyl-prolyl cis-trans isomerase C
MQSRLILPIILATVLLASCAKQPPATGTAASPSPAASSAALTPPSSGASVTPLTPSASATPTPTPAPAAIKVNGEGVPLDEYQASLKQVEEAEPKGDPVDQRKRVIAELVDETLLAQAALKAGFSLDDKTLQVKVDGIAQQAGGAAAFADWQTRMGYTPQSFHSALRRSTAAAWQRSQIMNGVPAEMEQVHARQILVQGEEAANLAEQRAKQTGTNFATLAFGYDLSAGGDLSWFPRGYLNEPAVEDAAFALQPGEISPVIKSSIGFHILQVIAREVRPLTLDARQVLQRKALAAWLETNRKQSSVEEIVP